MNITALTRTEKLTRSLDHGPRPLARVMVWELRRFCASRLFWLQALGLFCFLLFLTWVQGMPDSFRHAKGAVVLSGFVAGTSVWGLLLTLPLALVLLVLLLPFVTADGVTRDFSRRTHELLLTTALPTWAYVWGRYLVGLLMSVGLALLMLAALLGMGWFLHLTVPAYPPPQASTVLLLWIGMGVPATVLVSSLSFALGTLFPRLSMLVKVMILLGWIMGAVVIPMGFGDTPPPAWYVNWDPTSAVTALGLLSPYSFSDAAVRATSEAQLQQFLPIVENKMPDLAGWFAPHLLLAGLSLLLVLVAALVFKRSRDVLN
ncbi:MAG TPA: ABC transporter permease [Ktedonobacteraceae bacterium]|jgi:ABC-type transport system involved in multi-copper enzyme maturation permease subunit|nr:ABC transporter permease [Ktedonobacteraceae bacterium]